ncbi:4Fe-4S binding protein [bacterium]|nr:4Fe-4S binding protein [bacterium]
MFGHHYLKNTTTLQYDPKKCTGCMMCTLVCPHAVFRMEGKKAMIQAKDACIECGACALNCAYGAITVRSGVGCSAGIIKGYLSGQEPTCDCACPAEKKKSSCC